MRRRDVRRWAIVAGIAAWVPGVVSAQSGAGVELGALGFRTQYAFKYEGFVERQEGTLVGAEAAVRLGPITVRAQSLSGSLTTAESGVAAPGRSFREIGGSAFLALGPVLEVSAELTDRKLSASGMTVEYRLVGAGARLTVPLGMPGLSGTLGGAYFPFKSNAESAYGAPKSAFRVALTVRVAPPRVPLFLAVGYRFDRLDFEGDAGRARLEQVRGVVVEAGLRLGR